MCGSTPPGITICPAASTIRAAPMLVRLPGPPIAAILPPLTPISAGSALPLGITALPPVTIRSNMPPIPLAKWLDAIVHVTARSGYARALFSSSRTLAKDHVGGLLLRGRQDRVQRFQRRQKPFHSGELHLVILNLGAQLVDGTGVPGGRLRRARFRPGILPHDIGDGVELGFLSRRDLQSLMKGSDVGLDI